MLVFLIKFLQLWDLFLIFVIHRDDFTAYADVCFREFGDRVAHWTTLNEPNIMALASYDFGLFPPQRCTPSGGFFNCTAGNSSVEPYIAAHHSLLAHASAYRLYQEKYQVSKPLSRSLWTLCTQVWAHDSMMGTIWIHFCMGLDGKNVSNILHI